MSYRRPPHRSIDAGLPPSSMPDKPGDQDHQVIGLFVAGPIGALVGRVLAASMKNAGLGTVSPLDFAAGHPKNKLSAGASGPGKKTKPKPAAGEKSAAPRRRKRRRS